ncbi:MAG: hypothetical protein FWG47_05615, partial [Propionibacteriaceae bacterium]|nr:hypothetical protein [Propionibacteriaceae bacterium]
SAVVIKEFSQIKVGGSGEEMLQNFAAAVQKAGDTIAELIESDPELEGMGSTASGVMLDEDNYAIVNIGDSRTYLYRDGELSRLTHDHSFVQTLIDEGRISEEESLIHPHRSLILRVISGLPQHSPDLEIAQARAGDRILVCSDGLCGAVTDAAIAANIEGDRSAVIERLLELVYAQGAQDNISIIVADVGSSNDIRTQEFFGAAAKLDSLNPSEHTSELPKITALDPRPDPAAAERLRYSPTMKHRLAGWGKALVIFTIALAVVAGVLGIWYSYTQQQYFVGTNDEKVAIFRGIPEQVLSFPLSTLEQQTEIWLTDLPRYYRTQVNQGSIQGSLAAMESALVELRKQSETCIYARNHPSVTLFPPSSGAFPPETSIPPSMVPQPIDSEAVCD